MVNTLIFSICMSSQALFYDVKTFSITRSTSAHSSLSEDSPNPSSPPTPEPVTNPLSPHELSQTDFLKYFGLATHETYKEMQNKRAERKRRSTANPQFLYTKGWDMSSVSAVCVTIVFSKL